MIFSHADLYCTGASKVSLSSLSSQELWEQSGRLTEGSEVGQCLSEIPTVTDFQFSCLNSKIEKKLHFS
jgi:DNA-binding IclR family transcriptional regulator